jgi:replicative DNA helicase
MTTAVDYDTRTQPHDTGAERIVLGAMMLTPNTIPDVIQQLAGPDDFYETRHSAIYQAILELHTSGQPTDTEAVLHRLLATGARVPEPGPYLHTLLECVPLAVMAPWHAQRVRVCAQLRQLIEAGTRLVQIGYNPASRDDLQGTLSRASKLVLDATTSNVRGDLVHIRDVLPDVLNAMDNAADRHTAAAISTGLTDLDRLLGGGFRPGNLVIFAGRPGMGKALSLDTPLPTPTGWTTMGQVQVGDELIGADGQPTRVVAATDVMHGRPCYEVHFSDGSMIIADAQHLWLTETRSARRSADMVRAPYSRVKIRHDIATVKSTEEIASTVHCATADNRLNHSVALAQPFQLPAAELPIDPYVLGAWLGDGHSYSGGITSADAEIIDQIRTVGYQVTECSGKFAFYVRGLLVQLRALGVLNNKHIPPSYLRGSEEQRRALLAGLLDTDGSIANSGNSVRFEITNRQLALDTQELVLSLGYRCTYQTKAVAGRTPQSSTCYRLTFSPTEKVFRLTRKASRQTFAQNRRQAGRFITEVRPTPSVAVRCVQIDNHSHLYLAGRTCIPTHNSVAVTDVARAVGLHQPHNVAFFSLEMSSQELVERILAAESGTPLTKIREGGLSDNEWTRIARKTGSINEVEGGIWIDDTARMGIAEIYAKARRLRARGPLSAIVVDYLQLMETPKTRDENRERAVAVLSRELKLLGKELGCFVAAVCQLNRGPEGRTDKRPTLGDLRESGSLEQDADAVVLLYREDYYKPETERAGEGEWILAKNRHGPTGTVDVAAQLHLSRFVDLAAPALR